MVKKSTLMLLGLISIALFQEVKPAFQFGWTEKTVVALAPFIYYLHYKDPKMDPPVDYTLDTKNKKYWSYKNFWHLFDQLLIGQRFKPKSEKIGDRKIKFAPKDCFPKGVLGNMDAYIVEVGGRAAKPLQVIFNLLTANQIRTVLVSLK